MLRQDKVDVVRLALGPWGTNAYVVACRRTGQAVLIDAPGQPPEILAALKGLELSCVLITHGHFDHLGALQELKQALRVPVACHALERASLPFLPDLLLEQDSLIEVGELTLKALHTPGHTPGSLCFIVGRHLFSGDTLFSNGPGKTSSPEAFERILESLEQRIFPLPDETEVYPGHGEGTVLGREKALYAAFRRRPRPPGLCGDVLWVP